MTLANTSANKKRFRDSTDEEQSPSEQDDDSGDNYGVKSKAKQRATTTLRNKRSKPNKSPSAMTANRPRSEKYSKKDGFIVDDESDDEEASDDSLPTKTRASTRRRTGASSSRSKATSRSSGRYDDGEDDDDDDDDLSGDDGQGLDTSVILNSGRRTRGKKVDYSQFNRQVNDDDVGDLVADKNDDEDDVVSDSDSDGGDSGSSSISD